MDLLGAIKVTPQNTSGDASNVEKILKMHPMFKEAERDFWGANVSAPKASTMTVGRAPNRVLNDHPLFKEGHAPYLEDYGHFAEFGIKGGLIGAIRGATQEPSKEHPRWKNALKGLGLGVGIGATVGAGTDEAMSLYDNQHRGIHE